MWLQGFRSSDAWIQWRQEATVSTPLWRVTGALRTRCFCQQFLEFSKLKQSCHHWWSAWGCVQIRLHTSKQHGARVTWNTLEEKLKTCHPNITSLLCYSGIPLQTVTTPTSFCLCRYLQRQKIVGATGVSTRDYKHTRLWDVHWCYPSTWWLLKDDGMWGSWVAQQFSSFFCQFIWNEKQSIWRLTHWEQQLHSERGWTFELKPCSPTQALLILANETSAQVGTTMLVIGLLTKCARQKNGPRIIKVVSSGWLRDLRCQLNNKYS